MQATPAKNVAVLFPQMNFMIALGDGGLAYVAVTRTGNGRDTYYHKEPSSCLKPSRHAVTQHFGNEENVATRGPQRTGHKNTDDAAICACTVHILTVSMLFEETWSTTTSPVEGLCPARVPKKTPCNHRTATNGTHKTWPCCSPK